MDSLKNLIDKGKIYLRQYLEEMDVKLHKRGTNELFSCISPEHEDTNPSAGLIKASEDQQFHCFSCLEENQLVWTAKGLGPIKALQKGDIVITHDGTHRAVINTRTAVKNVMEIRTGSFRDPIILTHDHPVLVLKKDTVLASLSCVREEKTRELKFYRKFKNSTKRNAKQLEIATVRADEITTSDFLLFPTSTFNHVFKNPSIKRPIKAYTSGPRTERVWELSVTEELARLYGLYVAEGSSFRGGIKFSFHIREKDTLAKFTRETIEANFGKKASIYTSKKAKSCEVACSSTDLEYLFEAAFGDGAKNKQIPVEIFDWEDRYKNAFLTGYLEGDGHKGHLAATVSKQLAYGLYRLGIDLHRNPSLSEMVEAHTDSSGVSHSDFWNIRFCKQERLDGFYVTIDDIEYFVSKISSIRDEGTIANVVDIEVDQQHTFLSAIGAMHNCLISGDIYTAAHLLEGKPLYGLGFIKDNVEYILKRYNIEFEPVELTEEQLSKFKYDAVYNGVVTLMTTIDKETATLKYNDLTLAKARGWKRDICLKLGVGSVPDFKSFIQGLSNVTRIDTDTLSKMGIREDLFGPDLISFPVRDIAGSVRGFASRYTKWTDGCGVPKYRNTSIIDNPFYHKDRLLFCLDIAKKYNGLRLDIFEGYGSAVTAHQAGFHNCCAIGGTALTDSHVEIIRNLAFNHINLVLDQDATGAQHMEKYIEKFAGYPGLRVTISNLPIPDEDKKVKGQNDPDFYIQKYGINEYRKIKPIGVFQHMLQKVKGTLDPAGNDVNCIAFAKKMLPLVINEADLIERGRMINILSQETGVDRDDLKAEIERIEKSDATRVKQDLVNKLKRIGDRPDDLKEILDQARIGLESSASTKKDKYLLSVGETIEVFDEVFVEMNAHKEGIHGWVTGYAPLDDMLDGIPKPTGRAGRALGFAGAAQHGKALISDTLVLTPDGFKHHGKLTVGDIVFNNKGKKVKVLAKSSPVLCDVQITFGDGQVVQCHENHEWVVKDHHYNDLVLETKEIEKRYLQKSGRPEFSVDSNILLENEEKEYSIPPYLLGLWLGDGRAIASDIAHAHTDQEHVVYAASLWKEGTSMWFDKPTGVQHTSFKGLISHLRLLGLTNNKHIPWSYLQGSDKQRLELLAGLIDTDGYIYQKNGRICFSNCNKTLINNVSDLVRSLGSRVTVSEFEPRTSSSGVVGKQKVYQLTFNIPHKVPTRLPRKQHTPSSLQRRRSIVKVERVQALVGNCIQVEGGVYLVGRNLVPTHNSAILLNVALQVALRNKDVSIGYWAIDDNRKTIAYRLVSMISQVPMKRILNIQPRIGDDEKKVREAQDLIRELTADQKLVFKDDRYGRNRGKADDWIKSLQDSTGRPILFCIDSLHNVQGNHDSDVRVKLLSSSVWAKSLCASVPCTVMMTMELIKNRTLGVKPTLTSISESAKMEFDMDMAAIVWNEAVGNYCSVENVRQRWGLPGAWKPIIELDIQKNKTGAGERGSVYFKYDPTTTSIVECSQYLEGQAVSKISSSTGATYTFPVSSDKEEEEEVSSSGVGWGQQT